MGWECGQGIAELVCLCSKESKGLSWGTKTAGSDYICGAWAWMAGMLASGRATDWYTYKWALAVAWSFS